MGTQSEISGRGSGEWRRYGEEEGGVRRERMDLRGIGFKRKRGGKMKRKDEKGGKRKGRGRERDAEG